jgi:putative membrane protein
MEFKMWRNSFCNFDSFWGAGHWFAGGIFPLLFWGLILWFVVGLIQKFLIPAKMEESEDALGILKRRYAAGEIDQKSFAEMKKNLN